VTAPGEDRFSQLLYPMLRAQPVVDSAVVRELAGAPREKSAESNRLRAEVIEEFGDRLVAAAHALAAAFREGGRLLAMGNGGSATSAADIVAELMAPPQGGTPLPALCLTNDVAVVTGVANDVSFDDVFVRQVIALGRPRDVALAVSTSGNSENLVRGLREAARRGMGTIALCGYDGGRIAREAAVDHCFIVRSSSVHRIQEVQMTVYHLLEELVQRSFTEQPRCA
jgi:D-sedoheptulose 7-phosphate isomerase